MIWKLIDLGHRQNHITDNIRCFASVNPVARPDFGMQDLSVEDNAHKLMPHDL
jgi:hypothetical protein